jgi:hypothetical protein
MNCEQACHLIDDYLENRLSRYERHRLETHLTLCSDCAEELRNRPAFERQMWGALAISVQHLRLSSDISAQIVREAQSSARRAIWSRRAMLTFQLVASAAAVTLLMIGLLALVGRIQVPVEVPWLDPPRVSRPALTLTRNDIIIEPANLRPGQPFTTTIFLHSDLSQPVDAVRFQFEVSGPEADYEFELALKGPFPARGQSTLTVTPAILEKPCQEQYGITPEEIISVPGIYTLRATLLSPVILPEQ